MNINYFSPLLGIKGGVGVIYNNDKVDIGIVIRRYQDKSQTPRTQTQGTRAGRAMEICISIHKLKMNMIKRTLLLYRNFYQGFQPSLKKTIQNKHKNKTLHQLYEKKNLMIGRFAF